MKTRLRRPMTATVFMLAAVLVLSNASQIGARVVCTGSDGHVDVEPSGCTCCAVIVSDDERFDDGLAPTSPSCTDCVDVPLKVPILKSKAPQLRDSDFLFLTDSSYHRQRPFVGKSRRRWTSAGRSPPTIKRRRSRRPHCEPLGETSCRYRHEVSPKGRNSQTLSGRFGRGILRT